MFQNGFDTKNSTKNIKIEKHRFQFVHINKNKKKVNPLRRRFRINTRQRDKVREDLNLDGQDSSGNLHNNKAWKSLRDLEKDGCVRRFLCELATGHIVTSANDKHYKQLVKQLIHFVDRKHGDGLQDKVMNKLVVKPGVCRRITFANRISIKNYYLYIFLNGSDYYTFHLLLHA